MQRISLLIAELLASQEGLRFMYLTEKGFLWLCYIITLYCISEGER